MVEMVVRTIKAKVKVAVASGALSASSVVIQMTIAITYIQTWHQKVGSRAGAEFHRIINKAITTNKAVEVCKAVAVDLKAIIHSMHRVLSKTSCRYKPTTSSMLKVELLLQSQRPQPLLYWPVRVRTVGFLTLAAHHI